MLTNAGLVVAIQNLNGVSNGAVSAEEENGLVAKQNKVSTVSESYPLPFSCNYL